MNIWSILSLIAALFVMVAGYYALRYPNGKIFPSRRDKLLRKTGPLAEAKLEDLKLRFFSNAGGQKRVTFNATYRFAFKDSSHTITLPGDSGKMGAPGIVDAQTRVEQITEDERREFPESLVLSDGTRLEDPEAIRQHFLARLQTQRPVVHVLFDKKNPALSTVRDWP